MSQSFPQKSLSHDLVLSFKPILRVLGVRVNYYTMRPVRLSRVRKVPIKCCGSSHSRVMSSAEQNFQSLPVSCTSGKNDKRDGEETFLETRARTRRRREMLRPQRVPRRRDMLRPQRVPWRRKHPKRRRKTRRTRQPIPKISPRNDTDEELLQTFYQERSHEFPRARRSSPFHRI